MSPKIGVVPYINALPLCCFLPYPLCHETPVELDRRMKAGLLDVSLLPAFSLLENPGYFPYFSAGVIQSRGPVESVALFYRESVKNPQDIKSIKFSGQSVTSTALFKVIYTFLWGRDLSSLADSDDYPSACLKIGDEALFFDKPGYKICDLGEVWHNWTGLPFIYATWVSTKPLDIKFSRELALARDAGLEKIEDIVAGCNNGLQREKIRRYFTESMKYNLFPDSIDGLKLFQEYCFKLGLLDQKRTL